MKKTVIGIVCVWFIVFCVFNFFSFKQYNDKNQKPDFQVSAQGIILADIDSDSIIYEKNSKEKLYPASLTKIMTALLVLENTNNLEEILTVSKTAIDSLAGTNSSTGGLVVDEKITAEQALYLLLVSSGNDSANVIAEHYGGDENGFVEMMNGKAEALGMKQTHYMNAHGLHDDNHYTTTYDMKILFLEALKYDVFCKIISTTRYSMPKTNMQEERIISTTNWLCDKNNSTSVDFYYQYANGGKTGHTDEAGRCLASWASKNGKNYLCILMNSPNFN